MRAENTNLQSIAAASKLRSDDSTRTYRWIANASRGVLTLGYILPQRNR